MSGAADVAVTVIGGVLVAGLVGWLAWKALAWLADGFIRVIDFLTRHEP